MTWRAHRLLLPLPLLLTIAALLLLPLPSAKKPWRLSLRIWRRQVQETWPKQCAQLPKRKRPRLFPHAHTHPQPMRKQLRRLPKRPSNACKL